MVIAQSSAFAQSLDFILGTKEPICKDDKVTLRVTPKNLIAVDHYLWSNGQTTIPAIREMLIIPKVSSTFTVTVYETQGSSYIIEKVIDVKPLPIVNAGNDTTICIGTKLLLNANVETGSVLQWNLTGVSSSLNEVSPLITSSYIVSATDINGCLNTDTVKVNVIGSKATFSFTGITQSDFNFTDLSIGNSIKRQWDFGDGELSNLSAPEHSFSKEGFYDICLTVLDQLNGCQDKKCELVKIGNPKCDARYTFTNNLMNKDLWNFNLLNTSLNTAYFWNFGDGSVSTAKSPSHSFTKEGFYNVSLAIYDSVNKCKNVFSQEIKIGQPPLKADFNFYTDVATKTVVFRSTSIGKIKNYVWDFGNNKPSLSNLFANPIIKYEKLGVYKVCLVVTNDSNKVDLVCKDVILDTAACFAKFYTFVDSASSTVFFKNSTIGKSLEYFWEYGDGVASTKFEPYHKYPQPGLYEIALTVANEQSGCVNKYTKVVLVGNMNKDCHSEFNFQDDGFNKVYFGNNSLVNKVNKYLWNFGDGKSSSEAQPNHTFSKKGYYNVCLTTIDSQNKCQDTRCKYVRVGLDTTKSMACFNYHIGNDSLSVLFSDISIGDVQSHLWNFGDGTKSILQNPKHVYDAPGFYKVTQVVGNPQTKKYSIAVDLVPVGLQDGIKCVFSKIVDSLSQGKGVLPIEFKGASYGEPSSFAWDFGDGSYDSTSLSPTHLYTEGEVYIACLTIYDAVFQQSDTYCDTVDLTVTSIKAEKKVNVFKVNPNPVKTKAQIYYVLHDNNFVEMNVYDLIGNKVKSLMSEQQQAGTYNTSFDVSGLTNGVYFISMKVGGEVSTYKVVVVK